MQPSIPDALLTYVLLFLRGQEGRATRYTFEHNLMQCLPAGVSMNDFTVYLIENGLAVVFIEESSRGLEITPKGIDTVQAQYAFLTSVYEKLCEKVSLAFENIPEEVEFFKVFPEITVLLKNFGLLTFDVVLQEGVPFLRGRKAWVLDNKMHRESFQLSLAVLEQNPASLAIMSKAFIDLIPKG